MIEKNIKILGLRNGLFILSTALFLAGDIGGTNSCLTLF